MPTPTIERDTPQPCWCAQQERLCPACTAAGCTADAPCQVPPYTPPTLTAHPAPTPMVRHLTDTLDHSYADQL